MEEQNIQRAVDPVVSYSLTIPRVDCAVYDQTVTLRS